MFYGESLLDQEFTSQYSKYSESHLVYAWGKNEDGELGLENTKNIKEPRPVKTSIGYPRQISSAHSHTGLINGDGLLQMTGSELHNKLMLGLKVTNVLKFHIQPALQSIPIKQIACGAYHTLALADSGQLFSWGGTLWGKTGQKSGRVSKVHTLSSKAIIQIACGDFHSMVLTAQGQLYTWGGGGQSKNKGQLGHCNFKDVETPELVKFFSGKPISKIACGDYFSMVVTIHNQLYSWGEGLYGQLGYGNQQTNVPKLVPFTVSEQDERTSHHNRIQQISLGGKHTLLLLDSGSLYVCGYGSQGQLGLGPGKVENKETFTYCSAFRGVGISMVAGGSNHSIALTDEHNVYVCGYNNMGQLGVGDVKSRTMWTHVKGLSGKKVGRIYSGGYHSWAVLDRVNPTLQNYSAPEALYYNLDLNTSDLSVISRPIIKSHSSYFPTFQQSPELRYPSRFNLQIMYTSVNLCHRFIKFTSKLQSKQFHSNVSEYLSYCVDVQKDNMKHHRLTLDKQLLNAEGRVIHPGTSKGYTIMMVCGVPRDRVQFRSKMEQNAIGNKIIVSEKDLHNGRNQKSYKWFFKFNSLFDGMLSKIRIIQLRPSQY